MTLQQLQERAKLIELELARMEGEETSLLKQLADKHDCNSIQEAEELRDTLQQSLDRLKLKAEKARNAFHEKFPNV